MQEELLRRFAVQAEEAGWLDSALDFVDDESRPLDAIIDESRMRMFFAKANDSITSVRKKLCR